MSFVTKKPTLHSLTLAPSDGGVVWYNQQITCNNHPEAIVQKLLPTAVLIQADLDELLSLSLLLTHMLQLLLMKLQLSCLKLCLLLLQGQKAKFSSQSECIIIITIITLSSS